jgi:hypothetical protein
LTVEKKKGKQESMRQIDRDRLEVLQQQLSAALLNNFVVGICRNPTNWARKRRRRESKVRKRGEKQRPSERERERERDTEREREREREREIERG